MAQLQLHFRYVATMVLGIAFLLSAQESKAQDPKVEIKSLADTGNQSILATFNVMNPGNKTLKFIKLQAFRGAKPHILYEKQVDIENNKVPNIELGVAGTAGYDCFATLTFEDGAQNPAVVSPAKIGGVFVKGTPDNTDYGDLTNIQSVNNRDVLIVTNRVPDGANQWKPGELSVVLTSLTSEQGGRPDTKASEKK